MHRAMCACVHVTYLTPATKLILHKRQMLIKFTLGKPTRNADLTGAGLDWSLSFMRFQ